MVDRLSQQSNRDIPSVTLLVWMGDGHSTWISSAPVLVGAVERTEMKTCAK
jgi:hypothetical protein